MALVYFNSTIPSRAKSGLDPFPERRNRATDLSCFPDLVAVVVVLIVKIGVSQQLIRLIENRRSILVGVRPVADWVVVESFQRIGRQGIDEVRN